MLPVDKIFSPRSTYPSPNTQQDFRELHAMIKLNNKDTLNISLNTRRLSEKTLYALLKAACLSEEKNPEMVNTMLENFSYTSKLLIKILAHEVKRHRTQEGEFAYELCSYESFRTKVPDAKLHIREEKK